MQPFSWHHLDQWHLGALAIVLLLGAGATYYVASRRVVNWPQSRVMWFFIGLLITFLATQSALGVYDMEYFSAHMIQHLLLIMVAAPVFALSAPLDLAYGPVVRGCVTPSMAGS